MDDGAVSLDEISVPATDSKLSIHESFNEINGQMGGLLKKYEFEEYCGYEIILMKLSLEQLQQRVQREMITMKIDDTISKSVGNGCQNNEMNELNHGQSNGSSQGSAVMGQVSPIQLGNSTTPADPTTTLAVVEEGQPPAKKVKRKRTASPNDAVIPKRQPYAKITTQNRNKFIVNPSQTLSEEPVKPTIIMIEKWPYWVIDFPGLFGTENSMKTERNIPMIDNRKKLCFELDDINQAPKSGKMCLALVSDITTDRVCSAYLLRDQNQEYKMVLERQFQRNTENPKRIEISDLNMANQCHLELGKKTPDRKKIMMNQMIKFPLGVTFDPQCTVSEAIEKFGLQEPKLYIWFMSDPELSTVRQCDQDNARVTNDKDLLNALL